MNKDNKPDAPLFLFDTNKFSVDAAVDCTTVTFLKGFQVMVNVHTLTNGATVILTSPHGFKFSDGTVAEPQTKEVCDELTLRRELKNVGTIKGMPLNQVSMLLSIEQQEFLSTLCKSADIVIIPFPVLSALREQGIRDRFPNAVAFNATAETQRSAPNDKIVDINNWSF